MIYVLLHNLFAFPISHLADSKVSIQLSIDGLIYNVNYRWIDIAGFSVSYTWYCGSVLVSTIDVTK